MQKEILSYLSPVFPLNKSRFTLSIRLNSLVISTKRAEANWSQSFVFKSAWIFETNAETVVLDLSNVAVGINCNVCRTGFRIASNRKILIYLKILIN